MENTEVKFNTAGLVNYYTQNIKELQENRRKEFAIYESLDYPTFLKTIITLAETEQARLNRKVGYKLTKNNKPVIERLYKYIHSEEGRQKNLLICGGFGSGKTLLMTAFYKFIDFYAIKSNQTRWCYFKSNTPNFTDKEKLFCIVDEMGREELTEKVYGNEKTPFISFLIKRYDTGIPTLAISNLDMTELAKYYGEYIAHRIGEMFEVIVMAGDNFRK